MTKPTGVMRFVTMLASLLTNAALAIALVLAHVLIVSDVATSANYVRGAIRRAHTCERLAEVYPSVFERLANCGGRLGESTRCRAVIGRIVTADYVCQKMNTYLDGLEDVVKRGAMSTALDFSDLTELARARGLDLPAEPFEPYEVTTTEMQPVRVLRHLGKLCRALVAICLLLTCVSYSLGRSQRSQRGLAAAILGAGVLTMPALYALFRLPDPGHYKFTGLTFDGPGIDLEAPIGRLVQQIVQEIRIEVAVFAIAATALGLFLLRRRIPKAPPPMGVAMCLLVLLVGSGTLAFAEEWPCWRGPRNDGISQDGMPDAWPAARLLKLWSVPVGVGYSSPIGAGGRIYLFSLVDDTFETLTAYAADSGRVLWSESSRSGFDGGLFSDFPGTRATPVVDESARTILTFGGAGELIQRNLGTGKMLWRVDILKETGAKNLQSGTASNPMRDGQNVYVQGGAGGPIAVAVEVASGRIAWRSAFRGTSGYAMPVVATAGGRRQLIVVTEDIIVGMNAADGATLWTVPWQNGYTMPIVRGDRFLVTAPRGASMFKVTTRGVETVFETHHLKAHFNPPILDGAYLYGNSSGSLKCLSWSDGTLKWSARKNEYSLGLGGSLVRFGDKLLLLGDHGLLSLVRATPDGVQQLAQLSAAGGDQNFATPLIYASRIYVRGPSHLVSLGLAGRGP